MKISSISGLDTFLSNNYLMRVAPVTSEHLVMVGRVKISHVAKGYPVINQELKISVDIPSDYPKNPPKFRELGGFIPKNEKFHINPDGSICLGSPFSLMVQLQADDCFNNLFENFFIPYAYACLLKINHNIDFVFGELEHGNRGEIEELAERFKVTNDDQVVKCLKALTLKKRVANKKICPCGCLRKLAECKTHEHLNSCRILLPRSKFFKLWDKISKI